MRTEHEVEMTKLRQTSVEVAANLSSTQVKIDGMKDEISHVRELNENNQIFLANCHTLGNRCHNELLKNFSAAKALSKEKKNSDGDLEGLMRWVLRETYHFKGVLSAREEYCAWIGTQSTASVLLKSRCNQVRAWTDPDFKVSADHVRRSTIKASEWFEKFLYEIWKRGGKELSIEESIKNKEKVRALLRSSLPLLGMLMLTEKIL
jgi:hypothetical protein